MVVIPPFSPTPSPFPCTPIMYLLPVAFCLPTLYLFSLSYVIVIILWLITSPLSQASSNHHSSLNFYKINFFIFRTWVGSCRVFVFQCLMYFTYLTLPGLSVWLQVKEFCSFYGWIVFHAVGCVWDIFFIYWFYNWAILSIMQRTWECRCLFSFECIPSIKLAESYGSLFLIFWGVAILFSIMTI